jgi:uncharacterized membrane protein YhhN
MSYTFIWLALIVAIVDWVAVQLRNKPVEFIAKPGVMIVLLIGLWQASSFQGALIWFGLGLLFSMAGDIFLMLPKEQFIPGLVSFLMAHVAYLVGFNQSQPPVNLVSLVLVVLVGMTAIQLYRRLAGGLQASGHTRLIYPVLAYSVVISLMLISALLTLVRAEWAEGPALLVSAGALLFFLSDSFLGWNKFVAPLPHGKLRVIVTYHLGQILIVLGATLHFLA